jgi:hypothetical protein
MVGGHGFARTPQEGRPPGRTASSSEDAERPTRYRSERGDEVPVVQVLESRTPRDAVWRPRVSMPGVRRCGSASRKGRCSFLGKSVIRLRGAKPGSRLKQVCSLPDDPALGVQSAPKIPSVPAGTPSAVDPSSLARGRDEGRPPAVFAATGSYARRTSPGRSATSAPVSVLRIRSHRLWMAEHRVARAGLPRVSPQLDSGRSKS